MKNKDIFRAGYEAGMRRLIIMIYRELGVSKKPASWDEKDEAYMTSDYNDWLASRKDNE